jgi:hypothetical protein
MTNEERAKEFWRRVDMVVGINLEHGWSDALAAEFDAVAAEALEGRPWEDTEDEWDDAIASVHPAPGAGTHGHYATAMRMVGNRRSKGALVALVNWLLVERGTALVERDEAVAQKDAAGQKAAQLQATVRELREAMHEGVCRYVELEKQMAAALCSLKNLKAQ